MTQSASQKSGFSLVEMMVVIVIIGMLATAVAIGVRRHLENSRIGIAKMEIDEVYGAVEAYFAQKNKLPDSLEELVNPSDGLSPFLVGADLKDPWGFPYQMFEMDGGKDFEVVSFGADGVEGGIGENADISSLDLTV